MRLSRSMLRGLTPAVIEQALALRAPVVRVERLAARRQKLMVALTLVEQEMSKLNGEPKTERAPKAKQGRRKRFSRATLAKMRASQKARWAKVRERDKAETATVTASTT